jgi:hypothetical protein
LDAEAITSHIDAADKRSRTWPECASDRLRDRGTADVSKPSAFPAF